DVEPRIEGACKAVAGWLEDGRGDRGPALVQELVEHPAHEAPLVVLELAESDQPLPVRVEEEGEACVVDREVGQRRPRRPGEAAADRLLSLEALPAEHRALAGRVVGGGRIVAYRGDDT